MRFRKFHRESNRESNQDDLIFGRKPVQDALEAGRVLKVYFSATSHGGVFQDLLDLAKSKRIPFLWLDPPKLDRMANGHHQGVVAQIAPVRFFEYNDLLRRSLADSSSGPRLLFLDGIQDPQNVGSILRSAYFFGVTGVVIPKWRASSVTGSVLRASAGAAQFIPVAQVANLATALSEAKKSGLWILGADIEGQDLKTVDAPKPFGLVLGSEGEGLHQLVKERCDILVKISRQAKGLGVDSLNVGAATAAFLQHFS